LNLETYFSRFCNFHKSTGRHISPIKLDAIIDNVHIHFVLIAGHLNIQTYFSHFHNSHELTGRHISPIHANATISYVHIHFFLEGGHLNIGTYFSRFYNWMHFSHEIKSSIHIFFEDAQIILVPHFANSYGFMFEKNEKAFQSILQ